MPGDRITSFETAAQVFRAGESETVGALIPARQRAQRFAARVGVDDETGIDNTV
jgi:hypothetical protein